MRIQHNIPAMSSYRNYTNNVSALSKNLEKLSSGFKINRAGDDAAGLAISEKMRAQISGLETAQKNAKDGISLVQTAEGALTEVHDMLNRMVTLAEQSANGTYDNEVDRNQLQKELDQLRTEIDRIADSSNFNGIKLLDGSLAGASQVKNIPMSASTAIKGVYYTSSFAATGKIIDTGTSGPKLTADDIGKTIDFTVTWKDGKGTEKTTTVSLTFQGDGEGAISSTTAENYFTDASGKKVYVDSATGTVKDTQLADAFKNGLSQDEEFSAAFDIAFTDSSKGLEFTAKVDGSAGAKIVGAGMDETTSLTRGEVLGTSGNTGEGVILVKEYKDPMDSMQKFSVKDLQIAVTADKLDDIEKKIFEIDGHKFLLTSNDSVDTNATAKGLTADQVKALRKLDPDITLISVTAGKTQGSQLAAADAKEIAAHISKVTGLETKVYNPAPANGDANITADTDIVFTKDTLKLSGRDLTLQIGDTAEEFNKMRVKINDCHCDAMGIGDISIADQDSASAAMDAIKNAINYISDVRGTLGATQNRLDHTINNLSVMQQNIQDAESTIRDVDVAEEMMAYTKNNILVQSAQAMLAQANQLPQGVLQLLG